MVLFLSATARELGIEGVVGGVLGLGLAVTFNYLFAKGGLRIDLGRFFKITSAMLSLIILQLVVSGVHEFSEIGIITLGPTGMRIIGPLVKDSASVIFTGIMLLFLSLLFMMVPWRPISADGLQGIERRKALVAASTTSPATCRVENGSGSASPGP